MTGAGTVWIDLMSSTSACRGKVLAAVETPPPITNTSTSMEQLAGKSA